jgi:electron transfer flavoprotein alpha/beta subunit
MNILLAFKAEPDAGMLAEKDWQAAALDTCGPDVSLLRSAIGADEQAAAALLLAQRNAGCEMTLTALSIGDERALHWLRYFAALGFEQPVLLETAADLRFAPSFIAGQIADWQRQPRRGADRNRLSEQRGAEWPDAVFAGGNAGWPCFSQVERFTLEPPFAVVEQRTTSGIRRCRVRLPAVIAVRQCGEVALPVPGMRQRLAAAKADIVRQAVAVEATPDVQCVR